jgi:hypothetical protein
MNEFLNAENNQNQSEQRFQALYGPQKTSIKPMNPEGVVRKENGLESAEQNRRKCSMIVELFRNPVMPMLQGKLL